jgi:hypothetical protein
MAALIFVLTLLPACSSDTIIAGVNEHELTLTDARQLMAHLGYDINKPEDKTAFVEVWTNAKMMQDELESSDPKKGMIANFRSQLFRGELAQYFLTENELMKKVDTTFAEVDLQNYFNDHIEEFSLNDFIVKALLIKLPLQAPKIDEIKTAYLLKNDKDIAQVESYAKLYADDFYFDDENWILFQELRKKIALKSINKENLVLNRTKTYFTDKDHIYFLNILDYKLKSDHPPFDFVKNQIKERLMAQRLNNRRNEVEQILKENLKKKHDVQVNF